jgi:hypothetical protein
MQLSELETVVDARRARLAALVDEVTELIIQDAQGDLTGALLLARALASDLIDVVRKKTGGTNGPPEERN